MLQLIVNVNELTNNSIGGIPLSSHSIAVTGNQLKHLFYAITNRSLENYRFNFRCSWNNKAAQPGMEILDFIWMCAERLQVIIVST